MEHHFFAYINRMKFIQRWGLMRNTLPEREKTKKPQAVFGGGLEEPHLAQKRFPRQFPFHSSEISSRVMAKPGMHWLIKSCTSGRST